MLTLKTCIRLSRHCDNDLIRQRVTLPVLNVRSVRTDSGSLMGQYKQKWALDIEKTHQKIRQSIRAERSDEFSALALLDPFLLI